MRVSLRQLASEFGAPKLTSFLPLQTFLHTFPPLSHQHRPLSLPLATLSPLLSPRLSNTAAVPTTMVRSTRTNPNTAASPPNPLLLRLLSSSLLSPTIALASSRLIVPLSNRCPRLPPLLASRASQTPPTSSMSRARRLLALPESLEIRGRWVSTRWSGRSNRSRLRRSRSRSSGSTTTKACC